MLRVLFTRKGKQFDSNEITVTFQCHWRRPRLLGYPARKYKSNTLISFIFNNNNTEKKPNLLSIYQRRW